MYNKQVERLQASQLGGTIFGMLMANSFGGHTLNLTIKLYFTRGLQTKRGNSRLFRRNRNTGLFGVLKCHSQITKCVLKST